MNILISESEKERILGMHRKSIKKEFLFEYETTQTTSPIPIKKSVPVPVPEPEPEISTPVISNSENNTILSKLESQLQNIKSLQSELNSSISAIKQQQAIENTKMQVDAIAKNIQTTSDEMDKRCQNLKIFGDRTNKQRCKVLTDKFKSLNQQQLKLQGLKQESEKKKGGQMTVKEWLNIALATLQLISFAKGTFATRTPAIPTVNLNLGSAEGEGEGEEEVIDLNDL